MMDGSLTEQLQRLERCAEALETLFGASRTEGRMPSLDEAREADLLSREVTDILQAMPDRPCAGIADPVLHRETAERLKSVQQKIADALRAPKPSASGPVRSARKPLSAVAGSVKAYGSY